MYVGFRVTVLLPLSILFYLTIVVIADPQLNLLSLGCSDHSSKNASLFLSNLNATIQDIKSQVNASTGGILSATAERANSTMPVYALAFCRGYLSRSDCLICLTSAESRAQICRAGTSGLVIFDGCTLRYDSAPLLDQSMLPVNETVCASGTASMEGFSAAVRRLLRDMSLSTPRVSGYFTAAARDGVYAAAQCSPMVSETICSECLQVAYENVTGCLSSSDGRAANAGCFMRYSKESFFSANDTMDLSAYLGAGGKSKKKFALIGGVVGGMAALLFLVLVLWIIRLRRPKERSRGDILEAAELGGPANFHFNDLKIATNNFSQDNKLGEGGFGEVYKGTLKNGKIVAVKKLAATQSKSAKATFLSEVKLISNACHQNLLRYLGCSSRSGEMLLVYEYMKNGSLDKFLFGEKRGMLNWKQRFDIIVGMARGIAYLHQEFHVCVIHRDIKSSNVLLDDNFKPKIADFGLARLRPGDQSHLSSYFSGTMGYIAPEYIIHGDLTEKVDTFSFGVVVLEILTGQRNCDSELQHVPQYLLESAWTLYEENGLHKLIDKSLDPNKYMLEEVVRVMRIALLCTQEVSSRPAMSQVVVMLLSQVGLPLKLERPSFVVTPGRVCDAASSSTESSSAFHRKFILSKIIGR